MGHEASYSLRGEHHRLPCWTPAGLPLSYFSDGYGRKTHCGVTSSVTVDLWSLYTHRTTLTHVLVGTRLTELCPEPLCARWLSARLLMSESSHPAKCCSYWSKGQSSRLHGWIPATAQQPHFQALHRDVLPTACCS